MGSLHIEAVREILTAASFITGCAHVDRAHRVRFFTFDPTPDALLDAMASTLCDACQRFHLGAFGRRRQQRRSIELECDDHHRMGLATWEEEKPLCPLCDLIRQCLLSNADIDKSDLTDGLSICQVCDGFEIRFTYLPPLGTLGQPRPVRHGIRLCNWPGAGAQTRHRHVNGGLENDGTGDSNAFLVRDASSFHPQDLLRWLAFCRANHGDKVGGCACDAATVDSPCTSMDVSGFHLIDMRDGCVTKGRPDMEYFALSYVWGDVAQLALTRTNREALRRPSSLWAGTGDTGAALPRTISDAMALCKACDQRYLWVDSLCIVQDDPDNKHVNIQAMGQIYIGASLTIVAAAGSDANAGLLPCPLGTSKAIQPLHVKKDIEFGGKRLTFCTVPSWARTADAIRGSAWASRGWTLQEEVLTRRKLYFAGDAVLFRCRVGMVGSEFGLDLEGSDLSLAGGYFEGDHEALPSWVISLNTFPIDTLPPPGLPRPSRNLIYDFTHFVSDYLSRALSFPDDIIHAFQGILAHVSQAGLVHRWGIPVERLPSSLLWIGHGLGLKAQRPGFPSWSWAGWMFDASLPRSFRHDRRNWTSWRESWDRYPLSWCPRLFTWSSWRPLLSCYGVDDKGALTQLAVGDVQAVLEFCVNEGMSNKYGENDIFPVDIEPGMVVWTQATLKLVEQQLTPPCEDRLQELLRNAVELALGEVPLPHLIMFWTSIGKIRLTPHERDVDGDAETASVAKFDIAPIINPVNEDGRHIRFRHTAPIVVSHEIHKQYGGEFHAAVVEMPEMVFCPGETLREEEPIFEPMLAILVLVKQDDNTFTRIQAALVSTTKWTLCRPEAGLVVLV